MRGLVRGLVQALYGLSMDWGTEKYNALLGWVANKNIGDLNIKDRTQPHHQRPKISNSLVRGPCTHNGLVQNISQVLCEVLCEGLVQQDQYFV